MHQRKIEKVEGLIRVPSKNLQQSAHLESHPPAHTFHKHSSVIEMAVYNLLIPSVFFYKLLSEADVCYTSNRGRQRKDERWCHVTRVGIGIGVLLGLRIPAIVRVLLFWDRFCGGKANVVLFWRFWHCWCCRKAKMPFFCGRWDSSPRWA